MKIFVISLSILIAIGFLFGLFFLYDLKYGVAGVSANGTSMAPTLSDGQVLQVSVFRKPIAGDIISFKCLADKCLHASHNYPGGIIKRLTKINDRGCYWVEGDNQPSSNDSIDYGWLCPGEFKLDGVVIQ